MDEVKPVGELRARLYLGQVSFFPLLRPRSSIDLLLRFLFFSLLKKWYLSLSFYNFLLNTTSSKGLVDVLVSLMPGKRELMRDVV